MLLCSLCCVPCHADAIITNELTTLLTKERTSHDDTVNLTRLYFYAALSDSSYVEKATTFIKTVNSTDPLILFYKTLTPILEANSTVWPLRALSLVEKALPSIEQNVHIESPPVFEKEMVYYSICLDLPERFEKKEEATQRLQELFPIFIEKSAQYPAFLRVSWLGFFLEHHLTNDDKQFSSLYTTWGGDLNDLDL